MEGRAIERWMGRGGKGLGCSRIKIVSYNGSIPSNHQSPHSCLSRNLIKPTILCIRPPNINPSTTPPFIFLEAYKAATPPLSKRKSRHYFHIPKTPETAPLNTQNNEDRTNNPHLQRRPARSTSLPAKSSADNTNLLLLSSTRPNNPSPRTQNSSKPTPHTTRKAQEI